MGPSEVFGIPVCVRLSLKASSISILLIISISEQLIEKLHRQYLNFINFFELWNVYVRAVRYVEEDSIQEENVSLNIKMLAPREAQVKEELWEPLILNVVRSINFTCLVISIFSILFSYLIFVILLLFWILCWFSCILFEFLSHVWALVLFLDWFSFNINLPVLPRTLLGALKLEVENETFLDANIDLHVLVPGKSVVVFLLKD